MPKSMTAEEIKDASDRARLVAGVQLTVRLHGDVLRAELRSMEPGGPADGRVVWEFHRPLRNGEDGDMAIAASALARTAAHLELRCWDVLLS